MYNTVGQHVTAEQRALLQGSNFRIRPLARAGFIDFWQACQLIWTPAAVFGAAAIILTLGPLRFGYPAAAYLLCAVVELALLGPPAVAFFTLAVGVAVARARSKVQWPAVTFWLWWPGWKLGLGCVALAAGVAVGNYIWLNHTWAHTRLSRLQAYQGVDPLRVGGARLQDAGLVTFNATAGVDRGRTACLRNGATYCIAPIVHGADALSDLQQQYDFFMVGTDCCTCPGEFRCGEWTSREAVGALRLLRHDDQEFYNLATQEWQSTYGRPVRQPVFFTWVQDPIVAMETMAQRSSRILLSSLLMAPIVLTLIALLLNGVLHVLDDNGLARPMAAPLASECAQFFPHGFQTVDGLRSGRQPPAATEPKIVVL